VPYRLLCMEYPKVRVCKRGGDVTKCALGAVTCHKFSATEHFVVRF